MKKRLIGQVTSNSMDKTCVVEVETTYKHPLYGKRIKRRKRFFAHDEANRAKVGDRVEIEETRPLSKNKRWLLIEVLETKTEE